jgi:hypothetical protein
MLAGCASENKDVLLVLRWNVAAVRVYCNALCLVLDGAKAVTAPTIPHTPAATNVALEIRMMDQYRMTDDFKRPQ